MSKKKDQAVYTKHQFLSSKQFAEQKDLVSALLEDGVAYTVEQVKKKVDDFLQKEAK